MLRPAACLLFCCGAILPAQNAPGPRFEVASVKPSLADPGSSGITTRRGSLKANNVTLQRCIIGAYGIGPHQIAGGPPWLDSDRFEIDARADASVNDDATLMLMLQGLLAERFHLTLHRETKTVTAYLLEVVRNGPKLEKVQGDGDSSTNSSHGRLDARQTDMDLFAKVLARSMELPVVNRTGLDGRYNFKLEWTPEGDRQRPDSAPSIFTALQEQLGLRLRTGKAPVEVVVIDRAEKPTAN
jgi:uncharacterized protein (TIGR03435 family)